MTAAQEFAIGSLVRARGREWVVLPDSTDDFLVLRPLGGGEDDVAGVLRGIEDVQPATFAPPSPEDLGDDRSARLLRDALRIGFRSSGGPFRSLAGLAVDPRPYQLVPLLLALRQDLVRLLIADDVGIGKTVEAGLVAAELLAQGSARGLAVLCPPSLAEQWQGELRTKFNLDAELVLPGTVTRLERGLEYGQSLFERHPITVVSTDFIKADRRRDDFLRAAPDLLIVDEAHTCVSDGSGGANRGRTQRFRLLRDLARDQERHLVLVTATPHSGKDEAFRNLIGLLDPVLHDADLAASATRERLAEHMVQRRRGDIRKFLGDTRFPSDRQTQELTYQLSPAYRALFDDVLDYVRGQVRDRTGTRVEQRVRWWSALSLLRALASSPAAADSDDALRRLLQITVCDPACGSGHFLVAAARRIARRVAQLRSGDEEPTPAEVQHALREVVGHCIYGVDVNPLAAELAKVSLWLEALEPGKPLGFLDARIRVGNSLLGTTPALLAGEVPDEAFKELEGDDKKIAAATRKRNKAERGGQYRLDEIEPVLPNTELAKHREPLLQLADEPGRVREQAHAWLDYLASDEQLRVQREQADAWCAAFVWKLVPGGLPAPTSGDVRGFVTAPYEVDPAVRAEVGRLAAEYRFFHWHLEFPEIFPVSGDDPDAGPEGWSGGFSCLLGNPPWERVKLQEQEFFASRDPEIAHAPNKAARQRLINELLAGDSAAGRLLHQAYLGAKRHAEGESRLLRTTGRFPLTGRGDVNTYAVFAETFRTLTGPYGRSGVIVPTGIATDATTQYFFRDLVESSTLAALYDFENRAGFFDDVDSRTKFSLLTLAGRRAPEPVAHFAFFLHDPALIETASFSLTPEEILLLNPNTGTCPVFRSRRDAEITLGIYKRVPVLVKEGNPDGNAWGIDYLTKLFDMADDSHRFRTAPELSEAGWNRTPSGSYTKASSAMAPVLEAKMFHLYDSRWSSYTDAGEAVKLGDAEKTKPGACALPRYWVASSELERRLEGRWNWQWLLGFRDICRSTDERTLIAAELPRLAAAHTVRLLFPSNADSAGVLVACLSSFVVDYIARQMIGGTHMTITTLFQICVLRPEALREPCPWLLELPIVAWIRSHTIELNYTAENMAKYAGGLGDSGRPFIWYANRRSLLIGELDAAFFHLYGVNRDEADYILDTFPIVKRKDEAKYGEYRTKRLILDVYDRMAEAMRTGEPYQTVLDPPAGEGPRHDTAGNRR